MMPARNKINMMSSSSLSSALLLALAVVVSQTNAFSNYYSPSILSITPTITTTRHASTTVTSSDSQLHLQRPLGGHHFQLEELEDVECSTTDVLLNPDLTITLGETNGPRYTAAHGTWTEHSQYVSDDDDQSGDAANFKRSFVMKLSRTFISGTETKNEDGTISTNVGEIEYQVERTYNGNCYLVGGNVLAMDGEILDVDEIFGERHVGFFNMIDTTLERESDGMAAVN